MNNKRRKILIIGGSGFIGKYLSKKLSKENDVFILDIKASNSKKQFKFDIRKKIHKLKNLKRIDLIINLAAIHKEPGHKDHEYFETNVNGAKNTCDFAERINCKNIIFTSSIAPYGIEDKLKHEKTKPKPVTPYGSSKLIAEKIHLDWQKKKQDKRILTIVRPGIVFGKWENANMFRLVKLVRKRIFFYMGNKNTAKASIYVKELVDQIIWVNNNQLKNKFKKSILFNATMWPNPTIQDYVKTICKISNIAYLVPSLPHTILLFLSHILEFFSKIVGKNNLFSPIRLKKLVRSNLIKPSFLINHKYIFKYTLESSFKDWKKEDKIAWVD
jgi:nucleoside-diphosphate-sugar epimerase